MHIPPPRYDLFIDYVGQAALTSDSVTATSWTWSDSMTTLVIEGHTRMQPCVSSYTLDVQVKKEYHIPHMVSPYIGLQDRFNGTWFLHLEPKDARPTFKLRPHTINNKPQGFPGAPVHQVFAVLFQNNPT